MEKQLRDQVKSANVTDFNVSAVDDCSTALAATPPTSGSLSEKTTSNVSPIDNSSPEALSADTPCSDVPTSDVEPADAKPAEDLTVALSDVQASSS